MKLFNEEQLQEAYNRGHMDSRLNNTDYSITDGFKPIELPSDEEIEKRAESYCEHVFSYGILHGASNHTRQGYIQSAKWMKQQILNQNK